MIGYELALGVKVIGVEAVGDPAEQFGALKETTRVQLPPEYLPSQRHIGIQLVLPGVRVTVDTGHREVLLKLSVWK